MHAARGLALLLLLALGSGARAHDLDLARYTLETRATADAGPTLVLSLQLDAEQAATGASTDEIVWPRECRGTDARRVDIGDTVRFTVEARCTSAPGADAIVEVPWGIDGALLERPGEDALVLSADAAPLALPLGAAGAAPRPLGDAFVDYTRLGVVHILEGWDHLAFVLCLFLLARGWRLVGLITAFTVGHSTSLGLATLGVVSVPVPPTEAVIALSIAFVAREAMLAGSREPGAGGLRRELAVVVGFGLLHGLGFASVLEDLGVAATEQLVGLLAFNVGVEIGQLLFVGVVATLWVGLRRLAVDAAVRRALLVLCGAVGMFWFVQRVVAFG